MACLEARIVIQQDGIHNEWCLIPALVRSYLAGHGQTKGYHETRLTALLGMGRELGMAFKRFLSYVMTCIATIMTAVQWARKDMSKECCHSRLSPIVEERAGRVQPYQTRITSTLNPLTASASTNNNSHTSKKKT